MYELTIDTPALGPVTVLRCQGELDALTTETFLAAVARHVVLRSVVLDMSGVHFVDFDGLSALLTADTWARALGNPLFVAAPSMPLLRLLAVTETMDRLELHSCVSNATRAGGRHWSEPQLAAS